jgi:thiol-disulfide isomerase/thioredoxin
MESQQPNREDAVSKTLLVIGLLLVGGAIAIYHFSPRFVPNQRVAAAAAADETAQIPAPEVPSIRGEPAPAFELLNLEGKKVRLADLKGKVVLVNFWATWCGPCLLEIPWFIEFEKQYGPRGFEIVGISMDEEGPSVVKPFVKNHEMNYTIVMGTDQTPAQFGGLPGYPVSFVIDRAGNYYSKHLGLVAKEDIEDEIQILLRGSSQGLGDAKPAASSSTNPAQPAAAPSPSKG